MSRLRDHRPGTGCAAIWGRLAFEVLATAAAGLFAIKAIGLRTGRVLPIVALLILVEAVEALLRWLDVRPEKRHPDDSGQAGGPRGPE
jgi:hypothetical protein